MYRLAYCILVLLLLCSVAQAGDKEQVWSGELNGMYWGALVLTFSDGPEGMSCLATARTAGEERCNVKFRSVGGPILTGDESSFRILGSAHCQSNRIANFIGRVIIDRLTEDQLAGRLDINMTNSDYPDMLLTFSLAPDRAEPAAEETEPTGVDKSKLLGSSQ